jgi:hypothetical protein
MITAFFLLLLASPLDEVARVATAMVDGDVAQRIQTARSARSMVEMNPRDRWAAADNYEVHHDAYIAVKKTLIRLSRLCPGACDVNLWMPVKGKPGRIQIVVRNANEMSQFWTWGALEQELPAEMRRVLETGERQTVTRRAGMVSVLAPVRDSLGDIVGLVEVVSSATPSPTENVW